ncbi:MAG: anti-sigma factor family protein [Acidobacteriaceae bacterium]
MAIEAERERTQMKDEYSMRDERVAGKGPDREVGELTTEKPVEHLTSQRLDALLWGSESPAEAAHLQTCVACREEFESLRLNMRELRAALVGVAAEQRRMAVMPAPAHRTRRAMWAVWSMAAAAALLCVCAPLSYYSRGGSRPAAMERSSVAVSMPAAHASARVRFASDAPVTVSMSVKSSTKISDVQLMSDIEQDLSSSVPQAMLPLTVRDSGQSPAGTRANGKENE